MPVVRLKEDTNIKPKYTQHPSFIWSLGYFDISFEYRYKEQP